MNARRALVVGPGGLFGAYDAGVLATICRKLGNGYFSRIYALSVGVFAGAFFAAGQPDTIENTWRNLVDGKKLVSFFNPFKKREVVDREYLIEIFSDERSRFNAEAAFSSGIEVICTLVKFPSGEVFSKLMDKANWPTLMRAATAMPFVGNPVVVGGELCLDGAIGDPLPIVKALEDGFDEVVVVLSREEGAVSRRFQWLVEVGAWTLPSSIRRLVRSLPERSRTIEDGVSEDSRVKIIRPKKRLPLRNLLDTDKGRINESFDIGVQDAMKFVSTFGKFKSRP